MNWGKQKQAVIGLGMVLLFSYSSPADAAVTVNYDESFWFADMIANPLSELDGSRASVDEAVDYWNTLTNNTVTMKIYFGEFNPPSPFILGGSYADKIAFNKAYPFSYTIPGQLITGKNVDFFSLTTHEIGHNVGIEQDYGNTDRIYPFEGSRWVDLIRDTEGKGISGLWVSSGLEPTGAETFSDKVARGVKFEFTGQAASAVYGDVWMGGRKTAVSLPVEGTYQFRDGTFHSGSSLVHPYTRFGNMNAIKSDTRPFFNEAELAVFRDLGKTVDIEGQFGHSVYTDGNTVTNGDTFSSPNLYGIGLHIVGDRNVITQQGDLHADGQYGAGIRIEGIDNKVLISKETTVSANGEEGMGVLVSHGNGAHLVNRGTIEAKGQSGIGVYLNSGTWTDGYWTVQKGKARQFDNAGIINAGTNDAIRLAGSINDMTINFMNGSQVTGNIAAETGSRAVLSFGKKATPDGTATAELDPGAVMSMTGDINGNGGLTMDILAGKLTYTGTATVSNATIAAGASLFGNATYNLPTLTNHGTLSPVVGSDGNPGGLTINGNLVSDGSLGLAAYLNTVGQITVTGQASVNGSKVVMVNGSTYIPGRTYDILQATGAEKITGTVQGGAFTGLLDATAENNGTTISVTTAIGDNLGTRSAKQQAIHLLMRNMYSVTNQSSEMYKLFSLDAASTKQAFDEIAGGGQLSLAALTQSSAMTGQAISSRMTNIKNTYLLGASTDTTKGQEKTVIPNDIILIDSHHDNNWWLKFGKNWNKLGDDTNSHSTGFVIGTDRAVNENNRHGLFLAYGKNNGSSSLSQIKNKDIRFGLYTGYQKDARDWHLYAGYGWQDNEATRYSPTLAWKSDSQYHSRTIEIGGQYKYDLHYNTDRTWHTSPYIKLQAVRYSQDGYRESGAGVYDQQARPMNSTYIAGQTGLEFSKVNKRGSTALHIGYKHIFAGYDPAVLVNFAGNPGGIFTATGNSMDRNLLVVGLSGRHKMNGSWLLDGRIEVERGARDRNILGEVTIKHMW